MSEKIYDVPEVLAALEAAVAKRGAGYVYENPNDIAWATCLYTHEMDDGTLVPGCIVGQVYYDLTGEVVPFTAERQQGSVRENPTMREVFTYPARNVLAKAQRLQDARRPWGEALVAARRVIEG